MALVDTCATHAVVEAPTEVGKTQSYYIRIGMEMSIEDAKKVKENENK